MIRAFLFLLLLLTGVQLTAQQNGSGRLRVTPDGHYLQYANGQPFFWLGDTGWELFHRLNLDEINRYLQNRKEKGFTLIQAVILAEMEGLRKPNQYGEVPFIDGDPARPNEAYFKLVDTVVKLAGRKGLVMGLLPTWGDKVTKMWGAGPVVFDSAKAYQYGKWVGARYAAYPNIVWILGGDRPPVADSNDWRPVWRGMARGILEGAGKDALIAYHPSGGSVTSKHLHNEPWLHINMMQGGHGSGHDVPVWDWITHDRSLLPPKPTLEAEPNYEDHPVNPWPKWDSASGYYRDYSVRKQAYRSVFAGACGITYGHHSVWQFWNPREEKINHADRYWTEALDRPGAYQVGYLRRLVESRPQENRMPDQSLIRTGQGEKGAYMTAYRGDENNYAFIYLPVGKTITINTAPLKGNTFNTWWFNPRTGKASRPGMIKRGEPVVFTPPTTGAENDWVLVVENSAKKYGVPGGAEEIINPKAKAGAKSKVKMQK